MADKHFEDEKAERLKMEESLIKMIDQKFEAISDSVQKEIKTREDANAKLEDALSTDVPALQDLIKEVS